MVGKTEKQKLMQKVQSCSFALVEANLFLDSHPNCKEAIAFYEKHLKMYNDAVKEYEKMYNPITPAGAVKDGKWTWSTTPWPWERSEN
ncbi:MAG: spore coat protein CotJB [Clostridiales bacterium]|nr:spore coat protein CotJB [Clostridiales bacterium]